MKAYEGKVFGALGQHREIKGNEERKEKNGIQTRKAKKITGPQKGQKKETNSKDTTPSIRPCRP